MRLVLVVLLLSAVFQPVAGKTGASSSEELLQQTTAKYRNVALVEISAEKTLKSELNPAGKKFSGKIYLSSGLFRVENEEPDKSTVVYDGVHIWNEQPSSPDFPGPVQVTQTKVDQKNKAQILFATLLTKDPVTKNFKFLSAKEDGKYTTVSVEALNKDVNVKMVKIVILTEQKEVSEVSYQDDIGNVTEMRFLETKFIKKKNRKLFQYKPPRDAKVIKL